MKNLLALVAVLSMYSIASGMDYVDAKLQEKINQAYIAQTSQIQNDDSEYIANVCSGIWIDTENMNPECPSLEEYVEVQ